MGDGHRLAIAVVTLTTVSVAAQKPGRTDVAELLSRVGERVQEYYARAQSVMCIETTRLQAVRGDMMPDGYSRRVVSELRIAWDPAEPGGPLPEANVMRLIVSADGRPPKSNDDDACMDPRPVSHE